MKYKYENKEYDIPDTLIDKYVDTLGISISEAIDIWLEDNDIKVSEETLELEKKAKENGVRHQAKSSTPREKKKVERKPDQVKDSLVESLAEILKEYATNIQIVKVGKLIEFDIEDDHYKLDLIRQRKPKGKA
jgi:tyrosine-protein phosphatase YwqE